MAIQHFSEFKQLITSLELSETPAEFHGFLSGLIAGGVQDESWKTLVFQFLNDGHALPTQAVAELADFYQQLTACFDEANTLFSLWLPEQEDGFALADGISEWTNSFLLGLGLAQPRLEQETDEVGEAIDDLNEIAKLGYGEEDSSAELLEAGEEVVEYLRVLCLFLHSHFTLANSSETSRKVH